MVVGLRTTKLVEEFHRFLDGVDVAVEELVLIGRPVGSALAAGPVVGDHHDDGVVELAGFLEVVQDSADLSVGVALESGEHLGHPGEQPLLGVIEAVPGAHRVQRGPGLALDAGDIGIGVDLRHLGVRRYQAELLLVGQDDLPVLFVAHVETTGITIGPLGEDMVRACPAPGQM